jgi:hypothetical protein
LTAKETSKFGNELQAAKEDLELVDVEFAARRASGDRFSYDYTLFNSSFTGFKTFANYINVVHYFGKGTVQEDPTKDRSKVHGKKMNGGAGYVSIFILLSNSPTF